MTETQDPNYAKAAALEAIIANVKRLLRDAEILQQSGSAGSALALAILAFEEAGKGHIIEHEWEKPKQIRSHHSFRHMMAFLVLQASFNQKYGLDVASVHAKIAKRFADAGLKPGSGAPLPPMTDELREELRASLAPQLQRLTAEQLTSFGVEQRWLEKIANAVHGGKLEKIRQSGLYLDTNNQIEITSSPADIDKIDAERWKWAASRVLNILEHGRYAQPYSPLAEILAAVREDDDGARRVLKILEEHVATARSAAAKK